ncbi:amidophosphoribosyltransferase [Agaricicola taiwanensis]|uniref:Amidophosphoribosyltransferase n=1 Tax=Agaricicola taiwanensis TaxID=591372 RepID=A0A8J2YLA7_9RHOB|nr:ComF family protein [Agaricicola taiwanensis]GGE52797.1 amidophosphoribosyltransferase [Agaricicola taiwanensis]
MDDAAPAYSRALRLAARLGRLAYRFVLPPVCLACERPVGSEGALCTTCWRETDFIDAPCCDRLGIPLPPGMLPGAVSLQAFSNPPKFDRARAAMRYDGAARRLVHRLKYGDRPDLAPAIARWMARAGREVLEEADLLVPVPLHWTRMMGRRFNQAGELARALSRETGIPYAPEVLSRVRRTSRQVGLSASERGKNLHGAMKVTEAGLLAVHRRNIVLVDDVLTTGATLNAAAHALRRAGAERVDAVVAAVVADRA